MIVVKQDIRRLIIDKDIEMLKQILNIGGCERFMCRECPLTVLGQNGRACGASMQYGGPPVHSMDATSRAKIEAKIKKLGRDKTMTKKGAYQAMLNGEKVSPEHCPASYIYFDEAYSNPWRYVSNGSNDAVYLLMDNIDSYTIYTPPKKKVKMWQWAYKPLNTKFPRATKAYFTDEELARIAVAPGVLIQQLDYTEIEVEV